MILYLRLPSAQKIIKSNHGNPTHLVPARTYRPLLHDSHGLGDDQRAAAAAKQRAEQQAVSGPALQTAGTDAESGTVTIKTDVLELRVSLHGGDIIEAKLLKYPKTTEDSSPFELLRRSGDFSFTAPSGLMGKGGIDVVKDGKSSRPLYQASAKSFVLKDGQDSITVP